MQIAVIISSHFPLYIAYFFFKSEEWEGLGKLSATIKDFIAQRTGTHKSKLNHFI